MVLLLLLDLLISPDDLLLPSLHIALPLCLFLLLKFFKLLADAHFFFDLSDLLLGGLDELLSHSLLDHKVVLLSISEIILVAFLDYLGLRSPLIFLFLFLLLLDNLFLF